MSDSYAGVVEHIQSFYGATAAHLGRSAELDRVQATYVEVLSRGQAALEHLEVERPAHLVIPAGMDSPDRLESGAMPRFGESAALLEVIRDANAERLELEPLLDEKASYPPHVGWQDDVMAALDGAWQAGVRKERPRVATAVARLRSLKGSYPGILAEWSQREQAFRQAIAKTTLNLDGYRKQADAARKELNSAVMQTVGSSLKFALIGFPVGCTGGWIAEKSVGDLSQLAGGVIGVLIGVGISVSRRKSQREAAQARKDSAEGSVRFTEEELSTLQSQLNVHMSQRPERCALTPPPVPAPSRR